MIPERDDFWFAAPPSRSPTPSASIAAATVTNQLLLHQQQQQQQRQYDNNEKIKIKPTTAWMRYHCYIQEMEKSGEKFDQRIILEAMFRGNDLVYNSANDNCGL